MFAHSRSLTELSAGPPGAIRLPTTLDAIFADIPNHCIPAGEPLVWAGDEANSIFQIREGTLRQVQLLPDGRRSITRFLYAGDLYGLSACTTHRCTVEAITPVTVAICRHARLQRHFELSPCLRREALAVLTAEMEEASGHLVLLGRMTAEERVATFLLEAARRQRARQTDMADVNLVMSRLDIADHLGVTLETVCRVLATFRAQSLIRKLDRRNVRLLSITTLLRISGVMEDFYWPLPGQDAENGRHDQQHRPDKTGKTNRGERHDTTSGVPANGWTR